MNREPTGLTPLKHSHPRIWVKASLSGVGVLESPKILDLEVSLWKCDASNLTQISWQKNAQMGLQKKEEKKEK